MSDTTDTTGLLRITRGTPEPEELAALLLALHALSAAARHDSTGPQEAPSPAPGWSARRTPIRREPWTDRHQQWPPPAAWDRGRDMVRQATVR
ncbi:acyl-CoA carboxylase epsilon subunit [Streptomyces sp. UG1]|uniref:acyl-CoA carboxylase epsilon subunit n=1 Tax=Streptomyces sp. UG1 TaxID=3417652 RepID=UPI003CF767D5